MTFHPDELFYWFLNMSILGTFSGLLILLLRRIRQIPRRVIYLLWLIPAIRFLCPVGIASPFSLIGMLEWLLALIRPQTDPLVLSVSPDASAAELTYMNVIQTANSYFPLHQKNDLLASVFRISSFVWLAGALLFAAASIVLYLRGKREMAKSSRSLWDPAVFANLPAGIPIRLSSDAASAAVYGILHPIIVIPDKTDPNELPYQLKHEQVHIRRNDNFWRLLAVLICCLHWFNPLIWLLLKRMIEDMELSCDQAVLRELNEEQRKEYALAILHSASDSSLFPSSFRSGSAQDRIRNILSYKRVSLLSFLVSLLFLFLMFWSLLTNTQPQGNLPERNLYEKSLIDPDRTFPPSVLPYSDFENRSGR